MKQIGIIGAGISGLTTAKAFLEKGFHVTIFEKASSIGGVWEKSRSYVGVATQTTRDEYSFSDFPMPSEYPLWPSGAQVQSYLEAYATKFGVNQFIRFNTQITDLRFENNLWSLRVNNTIDNLSYTSQFDFVVICTGTFHKPYVPEFAGVQSFIDAGGELVHSSQVKKESMLVNKAVTVVGFAKSATDIATLAADYGSSCSMVFRKAQWKVPKFFGNKINMRFLLFSRFSEAFFNAPRKTMFQKILHTAGKPMVWAQWRALEALLKMQFKLKDCNMVPAHRIEDQISCSLGVAPDGFYDKIRSGKIQAKQTEIAGFKGRTIILENGETMHADLVICGTGFRQELPFLGEQYRSKIIDADGGYKLYRNILHPDVPQLGFVGFNSSLFSTLTSEIAANWLAGVVAEEVTLPRQKAIRADIDFMHNWRKNSRPIASEFSGTCVAPFNFMHLDDLMRDMGLPVKVKGAFEFFKPINPKNYKVLLGKRKSSTKVKAPRVAPMPAIADFEM